MSQTISVHRRNVEIPILRSQGPKPKLRLSHQLVPIKTDAVFHFKSAAARAKIDPLFIDAQLRNSEAVTRAVKLGQIEQSLVQSVEVKVKTHAVIPLGLRQPKRVQPVPLVTGHLSHEDMVVHIQALAQMVPSGFRQPSAKAKNWKSTSLVEQHSIRAGLAPERAFERSERGQKNLEARQQTKALIHLERLMRDNPEKAALARGDGHKARWFFGRVMALMDGDIDHEWLETIIPEKLTTWYATRFKYMHGRERDRKLRYSRFLADAKARQLGENLDGSPRRETILQQAA